MFFHHRIVSHDNTITGDDQHKRIDTTSNHVDVSNMWVRRPTFGPHAEHNVGADERREKHDLGPEEQPHSEFGVRNR